MALCLLAALAACGSLDAAWRPTGPFGGGAEVIRTVPKVRGLVIAGTRNGLLFTSTNGGASWVNLFFPGQFTGVLHALEVDPRAEGTWYAGIEGTNEWGSGVYKTSDAGRTWKMLPATKGVAVWSIALFPKDPDTVGVGSGSGVYLSRDAGSTWKHISPDDDQELRPVVSLAFHPADGNTIYAGTTHLPWRTTDGGANWTSIHEGMIDDSDVFSIHVDQNRPDRVFASACSGVYGSVDGANRWSKLETEKGAFRTYLVTIDPKHGEVVFAATTEGLLKSGDGGRSWRKVSTAAIRSIAFDSWTPSRIFFASTTAGLLVSGDGGNTLRESDFGFTNRNFTTLTGAGTTLYSSSVYESAAGGIYATSNFGLRWMHAGFPPADQLLTLTAAPDNPRMLFAAGYHSGILESADAGKTWVEHRGPAEGSAPTALLALPHHALLAATDRGLYLTTGGEAWKQVLPSVIQLLQRSGTAQITAATRDGAMVSTDNGESWNACGPTQRDGASSVFYGIAFDAGNPATALAATPSGLYRSVDSCRSWVTVRDGLEQATAAPVLFHPTRPGEAFVSQGGRVFRSTDGGLRWLPLDDETQGNSGPSSLFVLPAAPDWLFALFPRRGVFATSIGAETGPPPSPAGRPGRAEN